MVVRPSETFRFACGECRVVFELRGAPESEWVEGNPEDGEPLKEISLTCCPFCGVGAHELKMLHYQRVRPLAKDLASRRGF
jgi:hypothetical protein